MSDPTLPILLCALGLAVGALLVGIGAGLHARGRVPHKGPPTAKPDTDE
jgi:hypothetical protein